MTTRNPPAAENLETLLTNAARATLSEATDDFRRSLMQEAALTALVESGEVVEISVSDIVAAMETTFTRRRSREPSNFTEVLLRSYTVMGALMAIVAVLWVMLRELDLSLDSSSIAFAVIAGAGATVSFGSYLLLVSRRRRLEFSAMERASSMAYGSGQGSFVLNWAGLEVAMRRWVAANLGESMADVPVGDLLKLAGSNPAIDSADLAILNELFEVRNSVAHGGAIEDPELQQLGHELSRLRREFDTSDRNRLL